MKKTESSLFEPDSGRLIIKLMKLRFILLVFFYALTRRNWVWSRLSCYLSLKLLAASVSMIVFKIGIIRHWIGYKLLKSSNYYYWLWFYINSRYKNYTVLLHLYFKTFFKIACHAKYKNKIFWSCFNFKCHAPKLFANAGRHSVSKIFEILFDKRFNLIAIQYLKM